MLKNHKDYEILRRLGDELREISEMNATNNKEQLKSWKALNGLKKSRPMFMIDQICWDEMNISDELTLRCEDPTLRDMELQLRREIFRYRYLPDDRLIMPEIRVPKLVRLENYGMAGDVVYTDNKANEGDVHGMAFNNQLNSEDDLYKIGMPTISLLEKETNLLEEQANEIFGDSLDVRMSGILLDFHAWDRIVEWHGVNETIIDLIDRPEFMHKVIERTLESRLALLDQLERLNLLDVGNPLIHCTGAYTDELPGYGDEQKNHENLDCSSAKNMWTYGAAQIFSTVSPAMHDEFEIQYTKKWYERFGLGYYGCCEPLDTKIDIIRQLPNVRKISISPWADKNRAAENIGGDYVMSVKPSPAFLASDYTWKEKNVIEDLEESVKVAEANNCSVELILKDISTVGKKPERLFRWAEMARDICGRG